MPALLGSFASWLFGFVFSASGAVITAITATALVLLEQTTGLISTAGAFLAGELVDLIAALLVWLISLLPDMPAAPPTGLQPFVDFIAFGNRYIDFVFLFSTLLPLYLTIVTGVFGWKLIKFIRGA